MTLCGESRRWPLDDRTDGDLAKALSLLPSDAEAGWFIEGEALLHSDGSTSRVELRTVRAAAFEGMDCRTALGAGSLRVSGNEPGWNLVVRGASARMATMEGTWDLGLADDGAYAAGWHLAEDVILVGRMPPGDGPEEALRVRLEARPCTDTMSGARFPLRATAIWLGAERSGCAVDGRELLTPPTDES